MPEISRFFGIIIAMFHGDHNPPHFHARYGEHRAIIRIEDFAVLEGNLLRGPWDLSCSGPRFIEKNF